MSAQEEFEIIDPENSLDRMILKHFIKRYGKDAPELAAKVEARLSEIDALEEQDLAKAQQLDTVHDYELFQQKWNALAISPKARKLVKDRVEELKELDEKAWIEATGINSAKAYRSYLKQWPHGTHAQQAKTEINKSTSFLDGMLFRRNEQGDRRLRIIPGLPFAILLFVIVGGLGLVALGIVSSILSVFGAQGPMLSGVVLAVILFVFVKFILGKDTEEVWIAIFMVAASTVVAISVGGWLGLPVYSHMEATGLYG